jgi:hypothetical protein
MAYDIFFPSIPVIAGYLITYTLYKGDLIRKSLHVSLWNFILGAAFLICGGAGFILLILLDMGIKLPISTQLLYWHVELGLTLVLVTIFHFHVYWKSSRYLFSRIKKRSDT